MTENQKYWWCYTDWNKVFTTPVMAVSKGQNIITRPSIIATWPLDLGGPYGWPSPWSVAICMAQGHPQGHCWSCQSAVPRVWLLASHAISMAETETLLLITVYLVSPCTFDWLTHPSPWKVKTDISGGNIFNGPGTRFSTFTSPTILYTELLT